MEDWINLHFNFWTTLLACSAICTIAIVIVLCLLDKMFGKDDE
jgi:hypothetical protein